LVNGAYELATAGDADYELQTERQTTMDNILFIPGIANPVSEINQLLFGQGQQGTFIAPSLTASLISGSTFGTGVETLPDLSPRNNPFSQAAPSSRAAWFREPKSGRRNQHIHTENFSNAGWTKSNVTVGADQIGPLPGMVAQKIVKNNGLDGNLFGGGAASLVSSGQTWTVSVFAKAAEFAFIKVCHGGSVFGGSNSGVTVNLSSGAIVATDASITPTVTAITDGWYRISATATSTGTSNGNLSVFFGSTSAVNEVGNGTNGILLSGSMQDQSATLRPYQRVTTAFDVTESGQRDCFGVRADGTDDFYTTASVDLSGTDKVTVFAAIRKLSDAAIGEVVGLSTIASDGTFAILAPSSASANIGWSSKGTTTVSAIATGIASPATRIVTGFGDISSDVARIRINGVQAAETLTDQGTGNYRNDILHLFRRGGTTLPFNGNLYALIVAGGSYPLSTIQRVERILSRITPTVNL
jgi:hypothetical protein